MAFSLEEWLEKFNKDEIDDETIKSGKRLEKYHNLPVVDLKNELSSESIEIIKKLGIKVEEKIYTEYEFDVLEMEISNYYIYDGMTEEELSYIKSLDGTGITNNDVEKVLHEIYEISSKHNF